MAFASDINKWIELPNTPDGSIFDHMPFLSKFLPSQNLRDIHKIKKITRNFIQRQLEPIETNFNPESISTFAETMYKEHVTCQPGKTEPLLDDMNYFQGIFDAFFAGFVTTNSALLSLTIILMNRPDVEKKQVQEIDSHWQGEKASPC